MQIHQTDFSTGNVYRNIMEVAVPMIIAQILNLLYNIVDRMYIGNIPQVGDLAFSYVKRNRKIKDFGHVFPGHGGVLDRFDSVIFCAPLMELLILWLPAFSKGAGA